jgi:alpha-2-macroglobulin
VRAALGAALVVVGLGALVGGGCGGAELPVSGEGAPSDPPTVAIPRALDGGEDLVFPPPQTGRRARATLDERFQVPGERDLAIAYPREAQGGEVSIEGRSLFLTFNQPIRGASEGAPAGAQVRFEPTVPFRALWKSDRILAVELDRLLEPEKPHRLTFVGLESASGKKLAESELTVRGTTGAIIAGKTIGYAPVPGDPRPVVAAGDGNVAPLPTLSVLYDQPVHLDVARGLVGMKDDEGRTVPIGVRHAPIDAFAGGRVDRRHVIWVTPRQRLAAGESYTLTARDRAGEHERTASFTIAMPLAVAETSCSWYRYGDERCEIDEDRVLTNRRELHLRFNNPLDLPPARAKAHIRVTPVVRNLGVEVEGWQSDRLILRGDFRPSTGYRIELVGLVDRYGQRQTAPIVRELRIDALPASVTMPEGLALLDQEKTQRFPIASRNVKKAELRLWRVDPKSTATIQAALEKVRGRKVDTSAPDAVVPVTIAARADELVETPVDLSKALDPKGAYLATVVASEMAFGAEESASHGPVALLRTARPESLSAHVHSVADTTIVRVARLASGEPVVGAVVTLGTAKATTDAHGVVLIPTSTQAGETVAIDAGSETLVLPLEAALLDADDLFPELTTVADGRLDRRALVLTDRGIYRPGSVVHVKASAYASGGRGLSALSAPLQLLVHGPTGDRVCSIQGTSSARGGLSGDCALPENAKLGPHRIELVEEGSVIATTSVRVADFEPPRFKVDVTARERAGTLEGEIAAKYLFGATMAGAWVDWTVSRSPAPMPEGPLSDAGLVFREQSWWWDDEPELEGWTRAGDGALDAAGKLGLATPLQIAPNGGPQAFTVEADVHDESHRHVAGRETVVIHPASRYAGLAAPRGWVGVGATFDVSLGAMDTEGRPVVGATVTARLEHVRWRYVERRGPGGAVEADYVREQREVARCAVKSEKAPQRCPLTVPASGDYRVVAEVDGRPGGTSWLYAWREGDKSDIAPSRGPVVQITSDKARYRAGDTAKLLVRSPYPAATAVVITSRGELVSHRALRIDGAAGVIEVPITAADAPRLNATVTLLPIGARGREAASFRIGATALPVDLGDATLAVRVESDATRYRPGTHAAVTIAVERGGKPLANAEVALAVVDEGVLRMTRFAQPDPVAALHPPMGLSFALRDSRAELLGLYERSHVAGDGGGDTPPDTRKRFVETAHWSPALVTDEKGLARVRFALPDNLTEFRMMALALDEVGRGGRAQGSFTVTKPLLVEPVLPRFAHAGDEIELAAMVHNNDGVAFAGEVRIDGTARKVRIEAGQRERVAVSVVAKHPGERAIAIEARDDGGRVVDRVETKLGVKQPGIDQRPILAGAFRGNRTVSLRIPEEALLEPEASLSVRVGEQLWPELGARLEYLLGYPHGCVEQTTSSTLPLIAARDILPRIGIDQHGEGFYRARIEAGLARLATMRTASGGLGYWPGDDEENVYGTAYAMRAVVRAEQAGITAPQGMREGMVRYLREQIRNPSVEAETRAAIAESLAAIGELPTGIADPLFALRAELGTFGRAALALALGPDEGQRDRVDKLLDDLEVAFDDRGHPRSERKHGWYGSDQRDVAIAAMALARHRPTSLRLPALVARLVDHSDGYTTQATAYSLLALADHLRRLPEGGTKLAALLDGKSIDGETIGGSGIRFEIPLAALRGQRAELTLRAEGDVAVGYALSARYRVPLEGQALEAQTAENGPEIHRVFTRPDGSPVDLSEVKHGELLRVALLLRLGPGERSRAYLAVTDRLPAGFEPVDTDLDTVSSAPEIDERHPFADLLRWSYDRPSHLELHADRVNVYYDRTHQDTVATTYLVRASTRGSYALPPAMAELMYEPNSVSYSEQGRVVVR